MCLGAGLECVGVVDMDFMRVCFGVFSVLVGCFLLWCGVREGWSAYCDSRDGNFRGVNEFGFVIGFVVIGLLVFVCFAAGFQLIWGSHDGW